jgi:hypothetical protein
MMVPMSVFSSNGSPILSAVVFPSLPRWISRRQD